MRSPGGQSVTANQRPPEPLRPAPARRAGTSLLAARARRSRYRLRSAMPRRP